MNRRYFLRALGALAVAAAMPPAVAQAWAHRRVITDQHFYLSEPLDLSPLDGVTIERCVFEAAPGFSGDSMLLSGARATIVNCSFYGGERCAGVGVGDRSVIVGCLFERCGQVVR